MEICVHTRPDRSVESSLIHNSSKWETKCLSGRLSGQNAILYVPWPQEEALCR